MRGLATLRNDGQPLWRSMKRWRRSEVPSYVWRWLKDEASLWRRLQDSGCGVLQEKMVRQQWGRPQANESALLMLRRGERSLMREVYLCTGDVARVYSRTVIPARILSRGRKLSRLGGRPLGAALFADCALRRGERQWARIDATHSLFPAMAGTLSLASEAVWGRRAIYHLGGRPLLVTEVFLPAIAECEAP